MALLLAVVQRMTADEAAARSLADALEQLNRAGNYSWRDWKYAVPKPNEKPVLKDSAEGRTVISATRGYTFAKLAELGSVQVAFLERAAAFETEAGWRRAGRMKAEEVDAFFPQFVPLLSSRSRMGWVASIRRIPVHRLLQAATSHAMSVRWEKNNVAIDLGPAISADIFNAAQSRPAGVDSAFSAFRGDDPERTVAAICRVTITDRKLSRVTFDFDPDKMTDGSRETLRGLPTIIVTDIFDIGATQVVVPPELAALFRDVPPEEPIGPRKIGPR
jgi:hypothetical protein